MQDIDLGSSATEVPRPSFLRSFSSDAALTGGNPSSPPPPPRKVSGFSASSQSAHSSADRAAWLPSAAWPGTPLMKKRSAASPLSFHLRLIYDTLPRVYELPWPLAICQDVNEGWTVGGAASLADHRVACLSVSSPRGGMIPLSPFFAFVLGIDWFCAVNNATPSPPFSSRWCPPFPRVAHIDQQGAKQEMKGSAGSFEHRRFSARIGYMR